MVSFSSSVLNKAGRKFAPKTSVRRGTVKVQSTSAPPKPSVDKGTSIQRPSPAPKDSTSSISTSHPPDTNPDAFEPEQQAAQQRDHVNDEASTIPPAPHPVQRPQKPTPVEKPGSTSDESQKARRPSITAPPAIRRTSSRSSVGSAPNESTQEQDGPPTKRQKTSHAAHLPTQLSSQEDISPSVEASDETGTVHNEGGASPHPQPSNNRADAIGTTVQTGRAPLKPRKKTIDNRTNTEETAESSKEKKQRQRKKREPTPEGAELIEISPAVMKMSELCKDLRTGKKSRREAEIRSQELAAQERRQKEREERKQSATPLKQNPEPPRTPAPENVDNVPQQSPSGLRMRIVNGEIVLDTASLQVDRRADPPADADMEDVVENTLTRKINQSSYGKRTKTESWDEEMTDLFYRGLRMFGTDFMMISKMFHGRSRRQIKLKFNNEERKDPQRIKETLLGPREVVDIATYSELTNTTYEDPRVIQQQLEEERRQIEEEHAKEKEAQDELLRNPIGLANDPDVLPSIEHDDGSEASLSPKKPPAVKSSSRIRGRQ